MQLIEMFLNEEDEESGIYAVSVVENPATESQYIALKDQKEVKLAEVSKDKQILMGALLVPDKPIYRFDEASQQEYYIFFSKDTLTNIMLRYMKGSKQNNTTEEHSIKLDGNTIMEIWQKEDMEKDKSAIYGLDDPIGSIMVTMKVPDSEKYQEFKQNKKGFSLEGNFTDNINMSKILKPNENAGSDALLRLILARK